MLEYFVHLDKDDPPDDLVLAIADVPDNLARGKIDLRELPPNWRDAAAPAQLARFGDEFAAHAKFCLLRVPSVLAPEENNLLINPAHEDFGRIKIRGVEPLRSDSRLFRKPRRHRAR
jgi:RES domain-containing protein